MGVQNLIGLGDQIAVMPAHIHRPWRATAEVATGRSQAPEPHAPVNVNWIDLEMNCTRELMYAVQDVVAAMGDNAPTPPRGTSGVCLARRLAYIAAAVAAYADDSTREDLRIVRDRLEHHHGYTTEDDKRQVSLAATRRAAGLPADHTDTASNIARLAAACGTASMPRPCGAGAATATLASSRDDRSTTISVRCLRCSASAMRIQN